MGDDRKEERMEGNGSLLGRERDPPEREEETYTKKNTYKNLLALSISMTVVFTAFMSLQNLQSSLNEVSGLGVVVLSCVYGGATFSCFLAPLLLDKIGYKLTLIISMSVHLVFVGANFYPSFYTMVPAGLLVGLITGPIWISQGSVVTVLALRYAAGVKKAVLATVSRFSGIFFFFFLGSLIYGNVIASVVLGRYRGGKPNTTCPYSVSNISNITYNHDITNCHNKTENNITVQCGTYFCPGQSSKNGGVLEKPPKYLIYVMLTIFAAFALIGILIVTFVMDNVKSKPKEAGQRNNPVKDTLKMMISPKMLPLMPIMGFSGLEQAFMYGDFTQAFISCSVGVGLAGYAIACLGFTTAMAALLFGKLEKYLGITIFFTYAHVVNIVLMVAMLLWTPDANSVYVLFVFTALWGTADGIYQAGISAFLGHTFEKKKESAFAVFRLVQSLVAAAGFAYSSLLCMRSKTILSLIFSIFSWLCYMIHFLKYGRKQPEQTMNFVKEVNKV